MNAIIIIENREAVRQELIYGAYVGGGGGYDLYLIVPEAYVMI